MHRLPDEDQIREKVVINITMWHFWATSTFREEQNSQLLARIELKKKKKSIKNDGVGQLLLTKRRESPYTQA